MESERLLKQVEFIKEIDKLKYIKRKTKLINSDRHENDAEHSWHLAVMVMVLGEHANDDFDPLKVMKMLLIHDIVEIDSGDIFFFDQQKNHSNTKEELMAADRIFGLLPDDQKEEMIEVWKEFEAGETKEAQFAKALDRFEPILQNTSNKGGSWAEFNVPFDQAVKKLSAIAQGSTALWDYSESLLYESVKKGEFNC